MPSSILSRQEILEHLSTIATEATEAGTYAPAVSALTRLASLSGLDDEGMGEAGGGALYDFSQLSDEALAEILKILDGGGSAGGGT